MSVKYICVSFKEARERGLDDPWGIFEDELVYEDEYRMGIWRLDGVNSKFLNSDGGEPEDNSFIRDGAWITPALNEAYQLGYHRGFIDGADDAEQELLA
jgi:hypothetical protein